jgi:hypothetical protein
MSRAAVLATGAVAALLVGRAALAYRGVDPLALGVVLLIGVGLAAGVLEGVLRAGRAERLLREARALPDPATAEAIERASPPLRNFLHARIAGAPALVTTAPFTPYLLGMLVMIGLLGTFLGLFETLRGAREALSASGDVAALRAGLAAPMTGLSRAFGTSAAGVSASAMLGLGAVFVRRAEGRLAAVLGHYATTTLAPLTVAGRQLAALTALAKHGEALPAAAVALTEATVLIERLTASLSAAQERSHAALAHAQREAGAEAASAIRSTAGEIRADLDRGIARAAEAVQAVAEPLLAQTVAKLGEVTRNAVVDLTSRLDQDSEARRERDVEHLDGLGALAREATADLASGAAAAFAAASSDLSSREEARSTALHAKLADVARATDQLAAAQKAQGAARMLADDARVERLAAAEDARAVKLSASEDARVEALGAALSRAVGAIEQAETRADTREAARAREAVSRMEALAAVFAAQLETVSGRLADPLGRAAQAAEASVQTAAKLVEGARTQLEAEAQEAAARGQRLDALIGSLDVVAGQIAADAAQRGAGLDALARMSAERSAAIESHAEARTVRLSELMEKTLLALTDRQGAYESRLLAERGEVATALTNRLAQHAHGLDESLRATVATVREASDLVRSGGAEMVAVAEMFTGAVDRYREASDRWLDNLGAIEDAIARKDGGEAADLLGAYVAQTREVFDYSLQFQRELFTELRALRAKASS